MAGVVMADCVQVVTRRDAGKYWSENYVLILSGHRRELN